MSETFNTIDCPACGKSMKKIYLNDQGFFVDVCLDGCGGLWLDNRELKKIDEKDENIQELQDVYKDKTFKKADEADERLCPVCHIKMVKNSVSAKQEISIDECYTCGGKFFDYLELEQMRNQYENEEARIADINLLAQDSKEMTKIFGQLLNKDNFIDSQELI